MKRESPSAGYRTRQLYLGILRDRTRAPFQMRLYQDQNRRSDQRSNTISASVAYVPQALDGPVAREDLGFHPALAYKYSGERGACKVVIPNDAKQSRGVGWNDLKVDWRRNPSTSLGMTKQLKIAFVRRGYSRSGGAEAYLKRLADGIVKDGKEVQLVTTNEWPEDHWPFGSIKRVRAATVIGFADELEQIRAQLQCDVLFSLERVWNCGIYRAGDGVHRAWLTRRKNFEVPLKQFVRGASRKHRDLLQLEESLFDKRKAGSVITASRMVANEITDLYHYPADKIDLVRNGVPLDRFRFDPALRERSRGELKLKHDQIALLFAGSGWERKGLLFAIEAMALCKNPEMRLLVAGRGDARPYKTMRLRFWREDPVQFLGEVADLAPLYAAADIFILPTIYDPFSNACLEALASGLPVITTRSNGFSEIIENEVHGSNVDDPANLVRLRDAIRFWSDPSRRDAARSTNTKRASQFDISKNVAQTLEILTRAAV
jgi:UDP-glucose:(heptosyl)LPS alpha-1,3-glucosyltransferase